MNNTKSFICLRKKFKIRQEISWCGEGDFMWNLKRKGMVDSKRKTGIGNEKDIYNM